MFQFSTNDILLVLSMNATCFFVFGMGTTEILLKISKYVLFTDILFYKWGYTISSSGSEFFYKWACYLYFDFCILFLTYSITNLNQKKKMKKIMEKSEIPLTLNKKVQLRKKNKVKGDHFKTQNESGTTRMKTMKEEFITKKRDSVPIKINVDGNKSNFHNLSKRKQLLTQHKSINCHRSCISITNIGYVDIRCSAGCSFQFHIQCWKVCILNQVHGHM